MEFLAVENHFLADFYCLGVNKRSQVVQKNKLCQFVGLHLLKPVFVLLLFIVYRSIEQGFREKSVHFCSSWAQNPQPFHWGNLKSKVPRKIWAIHKNTIIYAQRTNDKFISFALSFKTSKQQTEKQTAVSAKFYDLCIIYSPFPIIAW